MAKVSSQICATTHGDRVVCETWGCGGPGVVRRRPSRHHRGLVWRTPSFDRTFDADNLFGDAVLMGFRLDAFKLPADLRRAWQLQNEEALEPRLNPAVPSRPSGRPPERKLMIGPGEK